MKNQNILRSTALLTLSGILAKTIDFVFRAYYSRSLGSEGMGIFSLVFSVHGIMLNVATGGLGVAVSKIVSEQYADHKTGDIKKTMAIALTSVFTLSTVVILLTSIFSQQIAEVFLKEPRCRMSLVYLSPSILFMGLSYCLKGYFYASRNVLPPASSEFLEQAVKITTIRYLLEKFLPSGIEHGCEAIFMGITLGEFSSCLYLSVIYSFKHKKLYGISHSKSTISKILKISVPVMTASISGSFLRMQEQVFTVSALRNSGLSQASALSRYGSIYGMVMPLIVFPLTLLSSCFTMLVPEISRARGFHSNARLQTLVSRIYRFTALFGFLVAAVIFIFADNLAVLVYNTDEIAGVLRLLSILAPIMFMDSVSCGILNGMGRQNSLLFYSISDCLFRIVLIRFLVPNFGIPALLGIIFASNMYTFISTVRNVLNQSKLHFAAMEWMLRHLISAALTCFVSVCFYQSLSASASPVSVGVAMAFSVILFLITETTFSHSSRTDFLWLIKRMFFNT